MTPEAITSFLTRYIQSLKEETREQKSGPKYGFDQIIHQLALAEEWVPHRLAFFHGEGDSLPQPKKEPEHGVDAAFLSRAGDTLVIFVLKDEVLNNRNWINESFYSDIARAADQNLSVPELRAVREVVIILAYNKGETEEGVESFDRFVGGRGTRMGDHASLRFERWNLDTITRRVYDKLLASPALLPENFFRAFTYLCWQVGDFSHGSAHWHEVLIPDWKEFLSRVLAPPVTERSIRLVSVALLVLRQHGKAEPSFETGWLDLLEWATLAVWDASRGSEDPEVKSAAFDIWLRFYLVELEGYYERHHVSLAIEHSLETTVGGSSFTQVASVYLAYWHMARLGLLAMVFTELRCQVPDDAADAFDGRLSQICDWLVAMMNANPSTRRPLLDLHHVQLFLVWRALAFARRHEDMASWLSDLCERLLLRRLGNGGVRVIDQSNRWDSVFEFIATGEEPSESFGRSSYLLLMLMELCLSLPAELGRPLLARFHQHLILGKDSNGEAFKLKEAVQLMGWAPPPDWGDRILGNEVSDGVAISVGSFGEEYPRTEETLAAAVEDFVRQTRATYPFPPVGGIPISALVLGCLKHESPLPSEFWRGPIWGHSPAANPRPGRDDAVVG